MPKRVQLSRARGWKMPPNTRKVDRSTTFGNPFAIGQPYRKRGATTNYVASAEHAVDLFSRAIAGTLPEGSGYLNDDRSAWPLFVARVKRELRGINLACWCPLDQPCHADVLLRIANEPSNE